MINIFDNKPKVSSRRKRRKSSRKKDPKELEREGRENLSRLSPMAYSLLALHYNKERPSEWIVTTFKTVNEKPHHLTDKWINSINKWVSQLSESMILDEPEIEVGSRTSIGPVEIVKIKEPNMMTEYPSPAIIAKDSRGWKWYFKTSKAYSFKQGDLITLTATVSSHEEGITFLKRPSKICTVEDELSGDKKDTKIF